MNADASVSVENMVWSTDDSNDCVNQMLDTEISNEIGDMSAF